MEISREMLRQYLVVVAVNLGRMNEEVARGLECYDIRIFEKLLQARIDYLKSEAAANNAIFSEEYYAEGITIVSNIIKNIEKILLERG